MVQRTSLAFRALITLVLTLAPAAAPPQDRLPEVGRLTGEMVVRSEDGREVGRLEASVAFSAAAGTGRGDLRFTPVGGSASSSANAQFTAGSRQEAFGAVTALVLTIAGRPLSPRSSLRLSDVRVDGDIAALRSHADGITAWWDAQGGMAVQGYTSPIVSITHLGRLQLNAWGIESSTGGEMRGYAILLFDPADPSAVVGGTIFRRNQYGAVQTFDLGNLAQGHLAAITATPAPNDFALSVGACQVAAGILCARLVIDVLADGTIDVRGVADSWLQAGSSAYTVEGTGNASFVTPGS